MYNILIIFNNHLLVKISVELWLFVYFLCYHCRYQIGRDEISQVSKPVLFIFLNLYNAIS